MIGRVVPESPSPPPLRANIPAAPINAPPPISASSTLDLVRKLTAGKVVRRGEPNPLVPPRPAAKATVPVRRQDPDSDEEEVSMLLEERENSRGQDEEDEEEEEEVARFLLM